MKKDDFLGEKFPDTEPIFSAPMDEHEVKYLLLRNASWGFMEAIQYQQAKQIADALVPYAVACKYHGRSVGGNTFTYPDLTKAEDVKEIFDEIFCKQIAEFVCKGVRDAV